VHYYSNSKFKAKKVVIDGHTFDSKLEAKRWSQLKLMQAAGKISHIKSHPSLPIEINGKPCGSYEADSGYIEDGKVVIEEVKGAVITDGFSFKWRVLKALYPNYIFRCMRWRKNSFTVYNPTRG